MTNSIGLSIFSPRSSLLPRLGLLLALLLLELSLLALADGPGDLDTGFGYNGIAVNISKPAAGLAVLVQADGKIVVAGGSEHLSRSSFALARYQTDGSLDPGFSGDGVVTTTLSGQNGAIALALQPDNKIVVAGWGGYIFFPLVRYRGGDRIDFYLPIIHQEKR